MPSNSKKSGRRSRRLRTSTDKVVKAKRLGEMLELRRQGYTLQEIADNYKISVSRVGGLLRQAIENVVREPAEAVRKLMLDRHEMLMQPVLQRALNGDMFAVDRALSIMNQQARLEGLYMAGKSEEEAAAARMEESQAKAALLAKFNAIADKFAAVTQNKTIDVTPQVITAADPEQLPPPLELDGQAMDAGDDPAFEVSDNYVPGGRIG